MWRGHDSTYARNALYVSAPNARLMRGDAMRYAEVRTQDNISLVTLNRPDRLNAIGTALLDDLHHALIAATNEPSSADIVLTGAGRAFCAGDDLKEFGSQSASAEAISAHVARIQQITRD